MLQQGFSDDGGRRFVVPQGGVVEVDEAQSGGDQERAGRRQRVRMGARSAGHVSRPPRPLAGKREHRIGHPPLEALVVHELLEQLRIVLHHGAHDPLQRPVMLDAGVLLVRVPPGVPEGGVHRHPGGNGLGDELPDAGRHRPR